MISDYIDGRPDAEWFNKVRAVFERNEHVTENEGVYYVPELRVYGCHLMKNQATADRFTNGLRKFAQGWEASEEEIGRPRFVRRYADVLKPFAALMLKELCANSGKGDRPGWLKMTPTDALLEIFYHVGKLQKALKDHDNAGIVEHSADVANLCLMMTDICGLLDVPGERPNSAWPTIGELMGTNIKPGLGASPIINVRTDITSPGQQEVFAQKIKVTMDRMNRGLPPEGPFARLKADESDKVATSFRPWPSRIIEAGAKWLAERSTRKAETQEKLAAEDFFGIGVPIEPDGHCEVCGELTIFAPVGGANLCSGCTEALDMWNAMTGQQPCANQVVAEPAPDKVEGFSLEELEDLAGADFVEDEPPVWLDTIGMFIERLEKAGWYADDDPQHEGIKEMFDESWAMRPALRTEELVQLRTERDKYHDALKQLERKTGFYTGARELGEDEFPLLKASAEKIGATVSEGATKIPDFSGHFITPSDNQKLAEAMALLREFREAVNTSDVATRSTSARNRLYSCIDRADAFLSATAQPAEVKS